MMSSLGPVMIMVSAFVFVAIIVALGLHRIISWYLDGAIGGTQCILIASLYISAVGLIIAVPSTTFRISLSLLLLGAAILLPIVVNSMDKANTQSFCDEKIERYRAAISADPCNLAARSSLSAALYNQGLLVEAIDELRVVVQKSPGSITDASRLRYLERELEEKKTPPITCPSCGYKNSAGRARCSKCDGELSLVREIKKWLTQGGLRHIVVVFGITMGVFTMVWFTLNMLILPLRIGIEALILLVVISSEYLYIQRNW